MEPFPRPSHRAWVIWLKNHQILARIIAAPIVLATVALIGYAWWDMLMHKGWLLMPMGLLIYTALKRRGFTKVRRLRGKG